MVPSCSLLSALAPRLHKLYWRVSSFTQKDEEDPDIQIVKVEKKRKLDSHSPLWSIFNLPSKMGDWLRMKTKKFSDQFAVMPRDSSHRWPDSREIPSKRNGVPSRMMHISRSKGHDNVVQQRAGFVADRTRHEVPSEVGIANNINGSQVFSDRESSVSSWSRPIHSYSCSMQCIRLQEREEYQKLLKMQSKISASSKFSSSPSRMSSFSNDSDVLSVSSNSSGDVSHLGTLSQVRQLSNTSIYPTRYKPVPSKTVSTSFASDTSKQFNKYKTSSSMRTSIAPLIAHQKRRAGFESPTSQTKSKPDESIESRISSHIKEDVFVIDDDEDEATGEVAKVNGDKSSSDSSIVNNGLSSRLQEEEHKSLDFRDSSYMEKLKNSRLMHNGQWKRQVEDEEMKAKAYEEKRRAQNIDLERRLRHQMRIFVEEPEVSEEIFIEKEEETVEVLPELTDNMMEVIRSVLRSGPPGEVLSEKFRQQITRKDLATLAGLNWLNDEVINFYMNMLMERGEQEGMSKVYAFNTFFYPKIMSGGHSAVKRWTKKVDIFVMRYILIPVHLGMHWCLCVVDMKDKEVTYYDSVSGQNKNCLNAVLQYINDESVAKKQQSIKKEEWKLKMAQDIPQQLNGSDCGMFSCKYADYVTRDKEFTFTQEDMPYFRQRMVYEIKTKRLLE